MPGSHLHALTFYDDQKIVICLSTRGKYADKFWFSFFHEIGHILHRDLTKNSDLREEDERMADYFSRVTLIPDKEFAQFCEQKIFTADRVKDFSQKISVHPGIVVGRLQKDGYINFSELNNLKEKYDFVEK